MILLLDTATPVCKLTLIDGNLVIHDEWHAGRELAKELLGYLNTQLAATERTFDDLSGIAAFRGPGSFTGLRIGLTVLNTAAETLGIPIVGTTGDAWKEEAIQRLQSGENDRLVMPLYGSNATITKPRK